VKAGGFESIGKARGKSELARAAGAQMRLAVEKSEISGDRLDRKWIGGSSGSDVRRKGGAGARQHYSAA
jgi:hypothetical protein